MGAAQQHETAIAFWFVFLAMIVCMSVAFAIIGGIVGNSKGRRVEGVLLGLFLGVIGLILIAALEPTPDVMVQRAREDPPTSQTTPPG